MGVLISTPTVAALQHQFRHLRLQNSLVRAGAALLAVMLVTILALVLPAGAARAAETLPDEGKPMLGAVLEWGEDTAAGFTDRLGASPALFGHDIALPFRASEENDIRGFLEQSGGQGAHAMLTVKPSVPLDQVTADAAASFAAEVRKLASDFKGQVLIRFAPDMNASWVDWGQQPGAYRSAFQAISAAFEESDGERTSMVWEPYLGKDYPYDRHRNAPGPGSEGFALLDTNGDGVWNSSDAAYAPYYPGDDAVDWVGLTAFHDDTAGGAPVNTVPRQNEFQEMLTTSGAENFYATYSAGKDKPFLLQTAAFYSPASGGAYDGVLQPGLGRRL
jgi:hypothetical protein